VVPLVGVPDAVSAVGQLASHSHPMHVWQGQGHDRRTTACSSHVLVERNFVDVRVPGGRDGMRKLLPQLVTPTR